MIVTIDTHVIVWDALKPELISQDARKAIATANQFGGIVFPEIILWEIAMLIQKKRVEIDATYSEFINLVKASNNYSFQSITPEIAELSTTLPEEINPDTADRLIAATSIVKKAPLITADKNLRESAAVTTIW